MRAAVAAVLLWLPFAALAQSTAAALFQAMDANGDGRVSEAEYVAYMSRGFDRLDRNHDGVLEADELPGGRGKPVSRQEWQSNLRREFRQLDHRYHGYLSARELLQPPQ